MNSETQPLLANINNPTNSNSDSENQQNQPNPSSRSADSSKGSCWKDWLPGIGGGIIFIATIFFIFRQFGLNKPELSIIDSNSTSFPLSSTGLNINCLGQKECRLTILKDRKNSDHIGISYWIETNEPKAINQFNITMAVINSKIDILINSSNVNPNKLFNVHLTVFLPYTVKDLFDVNLIADVGSLDIYKIPNLLGNVFVDITTGSVILEQVDVDVIDVSTKSGNLNVLDVEVLDSLACHSISGSIVVDVSFPSEKSDIQSPRHMNISTDSGSLKGHVDYYQSLTATSHTGLIDLILTSFSNSTATTTTDIGNIYLDMFEFSGYYDVESVLGTVKVDKSKYRKGKSKKYTTSAHAKGTIGSGSSRLYAKSNVGKAVVHFE